MSNTNSFIINMNSNLNTSNNNNININSNFNTNNNNKIGNLLIKEKFLKIGSNICSKDIKEIKSIENVLIKLGFDISSGRNNSLNNDKFKKYCSIITYLKKTLLFLRKTLILDRNEPGSFSYKLNSLVMFFELIIDNPSLSTFKSELLVILTEYNSVVVKAYNNLMTIHATTQEYFKLENKKLDLIKIKQIYEDIQSAFIIYFSNTKNFLLSQIANVLSKILITDKRFRLIIEQLNSIQNLIENFENEVKAKFQQFEEEYEYNVQQLNANNNNSEVIIPPKRTYKKKTIKKSNKKL
jgi:hypothetical protein